MPLIPCLTACLTAVSFGNLNAGLSHEFSSPADVAATASGYTAEGLLDLSLGFVPEPGTNLTVVRNTGTSFISGTFDGVPHGAIVTLFHDGSPFTFVADYFGENGRSLVLRWPLTGLVAWSIAPHDEPAELTPRSGLAGKTILRIAAGQHECLALTADGKIFAWNGSPNSPTSPHLWMPRELAPGDAMGARIPVAAAAGEMHRMLLCSDGRVFGWGWNSSGQLGDDSTTNRDAPVAVDTGGVLADKSLVAIAAGRDHSLALDSDGRAYSWGSNSYGALGNNVWGNSKVPVEVDASGIPAGKLLVSVAAGSYFSLALSADGKVYAWGRNNTGQLGAGHNTDSPVPVAVDFSGVLAGKSVVAIAAGLSHSLALTADGIVVAWGSGSDGVLGNGGVGHSNVPVAVDASGALAGKTVVAIDAAMYGSYALTADGMVFAWGHGTSTPVALSGRGALDGRKATELAAGQFHRFVLTDAGPPGIFRHPSDLLASPDQTTRFTVAVDPGFPFEIRWQVSGTGADGPFADITGNPSAGTTTLVLPPGDGAADGAAYRAVLSNASGSRATRAAVVTHTDWHAAIHAPDDPPFSGEEILVSGEMELELGFAPSPGTNLTVIQNTGTRFIEGEFDNAAQGGVLTLVHDGVSYPYVVNYYGGNGRSLVLHWPLTRIAGWGSNQSGLLGNAPNTPNPHPMWITPGPSLAGETILQIEAGNDYGMALRADGRLLSWGSGTSGQLGLGNSFSISEPAEVAGELAGKRVIAVSAGNSHVLALTDEGKIFGWGLDEGRLGLGVYNYSVNTPTALDHDAWFGDMKVVAVRAGTSHSMALLEDGRVFTWGASGSAPLGRIAGIFDPEAKIPREIVSRGVVDDRPIVAIAAGFDHSQTLASDGTLFTWGGGSTPQPVDQSGVLAGKSITDLVAGSFHSMVRTSDGALHAWGWNGYGQLGDGTTTDRLVPVEVSLTAANGEPIRAISCGRQHSIALTADGRVLTWGDNTDGRLGDGSVNARALPGELAPGSPASGRRAVALAAGNRSTLALFDAGPPDVRSSPVNRTAAVGATVSFSATGASDFPFEVRWQVSPDGPDGPFTDIAGNATAGTNTLTLDNVRADWDGAAYRAVFSNLSGEAASLPAGLKIIEWGASLSSPADVPFEVENPVASGNFPLQLDFEPTPGVTIPLIHNTGMEFIAGAFDEMPHGGRVTLAHNGREHEFIANYHGGRNGRSLVLQWPWMKLVSWGANQYHQIGDGTTTNRLVPVGVLPTPDLLENPLLSITIGGNHNLAITADGRVLGWGHNNQGQLGTGNTQTTPQPRFVVDTGVLAGKTVVALAAGHQHTLAVTSDGRAYAWGENFAGKLGNGGSGTSNQAVEISMTGNLEEKSMMAVAAGQHHSLGLTSEGRIFAWGFNIYGNLGTGGTTSSNTPVPVVTNGVLAGRTVIAIAAGTSHSVALSADGRVHCWGRNNLGQLGEGTVNTRYLPVTVGGALDNIDVVAIAAGGEHTLALGAGGELFGWGANASGQMGVAGISNSKTPVRINEDGPLAGLVITHIRAGLNHSLASTADGRIFAWGANASGQLGDGTIMQRNVPVEVESTGSLAAGPLIGIGAGSAHHVAMVAGEGLPTITLSPRDHALILGSDPGTLPVSFSAAAIDLFPLAIRWQVSESGLNGPFVDLAGEAETTLMIPDAGEHLANHAYRAVFSNANGEIATPPALLTVLSASEQVVFTGKETIPFTAADFTVSGSVGISLGFAPVPGDSLTVIRNAGSSLMTGGFSNLTHGNVVAPGFSGRTHDFRVNHFGGANGRDLTLDWLNTRALSWGANNSGQLGDYVPRTSGYVPLKVNTSGALAGKNLVRIAAGYSHNIVLDADGGLFAWGANGYGQLGNQSTAGSAVPVAVDQSGILFGETIIAIAAGDSHSLALGATGRVFAWGANSSGQLGDGSSISRNDPVAVTADGALTGLRVVAIAAGGNHSLALAEDGRVFAWGQGSSGQLGRGNTSSSTVPVAVANDGALSGKRVSAIAAGGQFSLALTTDGRVFGWGGNSSGQLGISGVSLSTVPVAAGGSGGVIDGSTVRSIAAGLAHTMALTSDGRVFCWGEGNSGQLGYGGTNGGPTPRAVNTSTVLAGKSIASIACGTYFSLAVTGDGTAVGWGNNTSGQLGIGYSSLREVLPVPVAAATGALGQRQVSAIAGGAAHTIALCGVGTLPVVDPSPASQSVIAGTTVTFSADADAYPAFNVRWQQSTNGPGGPFSNITNNPSATTTTLEMPGVSADRNGHAYRAVFTNLEGSVNSSAATLTVRPSFAWFSQIHDLDPAGPLDDPHHTNIPNLLAYAFALDPAQPDRSHLPAPFISDGELHVTFCRWKNADDVDFQIEVSSDLKTWQPGDSPSETTAITSMDAARERVAARILPRDDGPPFRFVRVRVNQVGHGSP